MGIDMMKKKTGAVIFLLLLCGCLCFTGIMEAQGYRKAKGDAENALERSAVRVESLMDRVVHETDIMNALVQLQGGLPPQEAFDSIAAVIARNDGVRAVQYLPDGIVAMCYPMEGNEDAIGDNVLELADRRDDARLARDTGSIVLSGPYELNQGGLGLVVRNPVYLEGRFWGFSAIVLDLPDSLDSVGLDSLEGAGYEYSLTARMEDGGQAVAAASEGSVAQGAVRRDIEVPNHVWTLAVAPRGGWIPWTRVILELLGCLAVSGLLAYAFRMYLGQRGYRERFQHQKELEAAYREAERSNREKEEFLSRMSHDLRMPLNGIQGLVELALADQDNPPGTEAYLRKIKSASGQLTLLVDQILARSGRGEEPEEDLADGPAADGALQEEVPENFGGGLRVMAVEDNPLNLEIVTAMLRMQGFEVEEAENGMDALELYLRREPGWFDVILMDIRMPVMDGLTAARRIRASGREDAATVPIIAVTANAHEEDGRRSREAGMNAHITKPIEKDLLLRVMLRCVREGR